MRHNCEVDSEFEISGSIIFGVTASIKSNTHDCAISKKDIRMVLDVH
jgi:hypothetical protein